MKRIPILAAVALMVMLTGCGIGNNEPLTISNLQPSQVVISANTGTMTIPVSLTILGARSDMTIYVEWDDLSDGIKITSLGYKIADPIPLSDFNISTTLEIDTSAFMPGTDGVFEIYLVASNPTETSNTVVAGYSVK